MNRSLHLIFLLGFLSISHYLSAQIGICNQVIASAGKATVQGGRTYAYTIGEPFIFTLTATSKIITQGFHQPDLCLPVLTNDLDINAWELEIYPNPASNLIHIRYSNEQKGLLSAQVFDLLGRPVMQNIALDQPDDSTLDCSNWQAGVYLIRLQDTRTRSAATVRVIRL